MEDFSFDISGILTEEEAKKLFEESAPADETVDPAANETEVKPAEEQEREASTPEIVGEKMKSREMPSNLRTMVLLQMFILP